MAFLNPTRARSPFMPRLVAGIGALGLLLGGAGPADAEKLFDESAIRGYDYTGPYAQFGISVGRVDFDDVGPFDVDSEASGGFNLGGGYRFLPWLAADGNFTFLGGEDNVEIGNTDADSQYFAFTFGPKFFPLGLGDVESIPHFVQPYALIAIGGGEGEIDGPGNGEIEESFFVARFILGFDLWFTDHWGGFMEGGGHVVDEDDVDGVGIFTFGAQYRF